MFNQHIHEVITESSMTAEQRQTKVFTLQGFNSGKARKAYEIMIEASGLWKRC